MSEKGHARLEELGVSKLPAAAAKIAQDLRKHMANIKDDTTRAFVEEAIRCHEVALYRSAIVMSWVAAVAVLQQEVVAKHLAPLNAEAARIDKKWKPATTTDDIGKMGSRLPRPAGRDQDYWEEREDPACERVGPSEWVRGSATR